ncbi:MAG: sulfite exporter TauE/SafE family protein, partial [Arenibacter sp.]|nr:sulfite exporter TauE/SafE family protein [Arenibacter sp.]
MEISNLIGYALAVLVGTSLGLIGSGGSILTVPILVYIMAIEPVLATAYSLFIVGSTSLIGGIQNALQKKVDFKTVLIFGIPSIIAVYLTRAFLIPFIPEVLFSIGDFQFTKSIALMVLFAIVMIMASISMIRPCPKCNDSESAEIRYNYPMIL